MEKTKVPKCNCKYHNTIKTLRCSPENPYCSIRNLVKLMEGYMSAEFIERQLLILNDFLVACSCAFWVRDLPFITRILELILEKPERMSLFRKQFETILSIGAVPPMLVCSTEILSCSKNIEEYFTFLACMLARLQETCFVNLIVDSMYSLLHHKTPRGICCVTPKMCYAALEASSLIEICGQLAEIADENLYTKLLKLFVYIVKISPVACHKLVESGALDYVMLHMDPYWKEYDETIPSECPSDSDSIQNFELSSEILHHLLDNIKACGDKFSSNNIRKPTLASLRSFRYAFRILCNSKGKELDRNMLFAALLKCLNLFPNLQYVQSELVDDIALLNVVAELNNGDSSNNLELQFTNSDLDYQFKKMLLFALGYIAQNFSSLKILQERKVICNMLQIITPGVRSVWLPQQHCKLAVLTVCILRMITPHLINDFIQCKGIVRLLMMIKMYTIEPYSKEMLLSNLKCIQYIIALNKKDIFDDLHQSSATNTLMILTEQILSSHILSSIDQQCLAFCFCILQALYRYFRSPGNSLIELCVAYMKKILILNDEVPSEYPRVVICGLDLLWECTYSNVDNIKVFVNHGGIYLLLDIIQKFSFSIKLVGLGVIVDLCEENSCIPYLVTWRGNGKNLTTMLMKIFRMENRRFGVKRTEDGVISDIEIPLMGTQQWYETFNQKKDPNASPASVDLLVSCRPKIYALLQFLNVRYKDQVAIANEHYRLNNDPLGTQDQITKLLAENFLALKLGETWAEVEHDFEKMGFRPIAIDGQLLLTLMHRFYKWALYIKEAQTELLQKEKQKENEQECLLYHTLNESKLDCALHALQELDYVARTTERMFRWSHKIVQNRQINKSLKFDTENAHRTFMHKIGVTSVFGQTVDVQSNVIKHPHETKFDIKPVSRSTSEEGHICILSSGGSETSNSTFSGN